MKENGRFVKVFQDGGMLSSMEVWVDTVTGVNYLYRHDGYSGGLTVLVDAEGKPVVTPLNG